MACSSTCPTQDHESFGACLRDKGLATIWLGGTGPSQGDQKRWDGVNARYRKALHEGLQPSGFTHGAIDRAYRTADNGV